MPEPFYLTTPIYYVNARPHIGHAYTTIVADVLARRARMQGRPTYFLTGTDEHGQKIERSAAAAGIPPQQFADQVSASFQSLWDRMGITYSQFIRTTSPTHKQGVQQLFRTLYDNGKIYLSSYTGQYSIGEEMFVEGPPGTIGPDGRPTETVTEENFFFRLSNYQLPLLNLIESDTLRITPESRKNEVLSFLRGDTSQSKVILSEGASAPQSKDPESLGPAHTASTGNLPHTAAGNPYVPGALRDLSISRSSFTWGIPVPQDIQEKAGATQAHIIYVWLDALANYITALGYGSDDDSKFKEFWPPTQDSALHLVGKEIIRFHCVYWPAFLLAAGLPLPKAVSAHGWLLFDDSKMSKSKGNIVRTETILAAFGTLCPPPPSASVIPSEAWQSDAQPRNPRISPEAEPSSPPTQQSVIPSAARNPGSSLEAAPSSAPTQHSVILSAAKNPGSSPEAPRSSTPVILTEAQSAQSKNLPDPPSLTADPGSPPPIPTPHDRDLFAADVLRYFLLREIPFGQDGSFTFEALITRYNADLANGYGNLVSRTLNVIAQSRRSEIPPFHMSGVDPVAIESRRLFETLLTISEACNSDFSETRLTRVLTSIIVALTSTDAYISKCAPWKLAKSNDFADRARLDAVLYTAAEAIRIITILLHPILPYATTRIWQQLGLDPVQLTTPNSPQTTLTWGTLLPGTKLGKVYPVFPSIKKQDFPAFIQIMTDMENTPPASQKADLTAITANNDATHPDQNDFPEAPLADEAAITRSVPSSVQSVVESSSTTSKKPLSRLVDETSGHTSTTTPAPFDPAAPPRTSALNISDPGTTVAGSHAVTTERTGTPPHTEAQPSGIFATQSTDAAPQITIDDFAKIELRVAQVIVAERIPKADKLLRLEVDLGTEKRQILSGIAEWYTPEELVGRRIVVITNLAPRKMRGLESHGMLLAASAPEREGEKAGKPHLATFAGADDLPLGSRLK